GAQEPHLNAFYLFDPDEVRADAEASAKRWASGKPASKFDGVPVTVKENVPRRGKPVPSGTALPNPPVAHSNAPIVDRLEEQGQMLSSRRLSCLRMLVLNLLRFRRSSPRHS
ncbi:amidase family protein, partial [Brevibacterium paucivorans]